MEELERALRSYLAKSYPSFTVTDLAALMKQVLAARLDSNQEEIKKMLTSSSLKPSAKSSAVELELNSSDSLKSHPLSISRRTGNTQDLSSRPTRDATQLRSSPSSSRRGDSGVSRRSPGQKRKQNSWLAPAWFAATLALAIFGILFKTQINAAKDALSVVLRATPNIVRVKVNGKNIQNGRYIRTPSSIHLDAVTNLIEIIRAGYATETISVDTSRNEHRTIQVIPLKPKAAFAPSRIVLTGNAAIQINVNEGFAAALLTPQQPVMEIKDLVEGVTANVVISEKGKQAFKCRFTPTRATQRRPFIVIIEPDRENCNSRGPRDRGEP